MVWSCLTLAGLVLSYRQSDAVGQGIVLLLLVGSVVTWSVMATKGLDLRRTRQNTEKFLAAFHKESHPLGAYMKRQRFGNCPVFAVYSAVCRDITHMLAAGGENPEDLFLGGLAENRRRLRAGQVRGLEAVAERAMGEQGLWLEDNMGYLSTAVSAAPFLGLLGTVYGVLMAFQGMAITGAPTLAAVAPGISGALLTTVVGLVVALPSLIGYNFLQARIRRQTVRMESFARELLCDIESVLMEEQG